MLVAFCLFHTNYQHIILKIFRFPSVEDVTSTKMWPMRRENGVRWGSSCGSADSDAIGRVFSSASIQQKAVCSSSFDKSVLWSVWRQSLFAHLVKASRPLFRCGILDRTKDHRILRWAVSSWIWCEFTWCRGLWIALMTPIKFFTLSDATNPDFPLSATKRTNA